MAKSDLALTEFCDFDLDDELEDADSPASTIVGSLRFLQRQAEFAGMPLTAHLISAAALSAQEEDPPDFLKHAN
jgi:hypothetical protein